jgi:DNA-directed RNA polymerase subunit alpha
MSTLNCIESYTDDENNSYACFLIEPLEVGHAITLGNALRRTLLSDLSGFAITGARIADVKHEFASVEGIREDILEILLNLKEIKFAASFLTKEKVKELKKKNFKFTGILNVKGPLVVHAGMFYLPQHLVKILNPRQYICTLVTPREFSLEIDIENGIGYKLAEEMATENLFETFHPNRPNTLLVDGLFMPIKRVNYKVKLIHDAKGNIKESLSFEILTNGSITPHRSLQEALKVLMNLCYGLFVNEDFLALLEAEVSTMQ